MMPNKQELIFNLTIASLLTLTLCFNWLIDVSLLPLILNPLIIGSICYLFAENYYRNYKNIISSSFPNSKYGLHYLLLIVVYGTLVTNSNQDSLVSFAISYALPILVTPLWIAITQQLIHKFTYKTVFLFTALLTLA